MGRVLFWLWLEQAIRIAQTAGAFSSQALGPAFRADRILIQPKAGSSLAALARFQAAHKSEVLQTLEAIGRLQVLGVPGGETVSSLIAKYEQSGLVEFAEPDYTIHVFATPDDPKFLDGTLWGLNNTGQNGGTPDADIDAPEAWDVLSSASNVVVAVLDTGVRYTHEDLAANMWVNPNDGGHGTNALAGTNDPSDDSGHGTMIAGILGAVGNYGIGVVGVAWRVQIMACKCFDNFGVGNVSAAVACLDYARANGARIINASWGFTNSLALSNAFYSVRNAGVIVVAAAGNSHADIDVSPTYPASYDFDNVVSVAYTTRNDTLGTNSNYGATNVDLAAPGEQIYSTFGATDSFYFTNTGSSFAAAYADRNPPANHRSRAECHGPLAFACWQMPDRRSPQFAESAQPANQFERDFGVGRRALSVAVVRRTKPDMCDRGCDQPDELGARIHQHNFGRRNL